MPPLPALNRTGLFASPVRNLVWGLLYMAVVMISATLSYMAAGWSLGDAAYMVVVTVYTVGYGEVRPIDTVLLRTITISTIVMGCTGVIFLTSALVQFITLTQFEQLFGGKRMNQQVDKLTDHVIVCGLGRIGAMLAADLHAGGVAFVVLERDETRVTEARAQGFLALQADATEEAALITAGVERARILATVLPDDAANVFITLSARSLNARLNIIARGEAQSTERKLLHAGANRVVLPAHIGAERIAELILYDRTAALLRESAEMQGFERTLHTLGLNLDVMTAAPQSPAVGRTVAEVEHAADGAFFVVQINRRDGTTLSHPDPALRIEAGDGLVLIGRVLGGLGLFEAGSRYAFRKSAR